MNLLQGLSNLTVLTIASNHEGMICGASYSDNCRWRGILSMPNGRMLVSTQDVFPSEESATATMKAIVEECVKYDSQKLTP